MKVHGAFEKVMRIREPFGMRSKIFMRDLGIILIFFLDKIMLYACCLVVPKALVIFLEFFKWFLPPLA